VAPNEPVLGFGDVGFIFASDQEALQFCEYTAWNQSVSVRWPVPHCTVAAIALLAGWLLHRIARRTPRFRQTGRCPACGYDLTGNVSGVCPECGSADERDGDDQAGKVTWRTKIKSWTVRRRTR
jgi:hypothetical protein